MSENNTTTGAGALFAIATTEGSLYVLQIVRKSLKK